jgi:hypothetical protein
MLVYNYASAMALIWWKLGWLRVAVIFYKLFRGLGTGKANGADLICCSDKNKSEAIIFHK